MTQALNAKVSGLMKTLGLRVTHRSPDRVTAELTATPELLNMFDLLHGGAIMAFADTLGGMAAIENLREGQTTLTTESKTNFFRPVAPGETAFAECLPLHIGRKTSVWQTTIRNGAGKLVAQVTQTQLFFDKP